MRIANFCFLAFCFLARLVGALNSSHARCNGNLHVRPVASPSGTNIMVSSCMSDVCAVQSVVAAALPTLEQRQRIDVGSADACPSTFDGTVTMGAALSLGHKDTWFKVDQEQRRCLEIFATLVNARGGLSVGGSHYAVQTSFVGFGSLITRVTGSVAQLSRGGAGAHFLIGPFGSSLTKYAAQQALAEGKIMISPTASTPSVIGQNALTFGLLPPANKEVEAVARAVAAAAARCDTTPSSVPPSHPCSEGQRRQRCARPGGTAGSCSDALLAGFVYEDTTFTSFMCSVGPATMASLGLPYALDDTGAPLSQKVSAVAPPSAADAGYPAYVAALVEALRPLKLANVTFVVGCTYFMGGRALLDALAQLDYSPLAVQVSSTLSDQRFDDAMAAGWWHGEYALEGAAWERSDTSTRGSWTNLTGAEFSALYASHYAGSVGYLGTAAFASAVVLASAIESAGTLETEAVRQALVAMDLVEFFTHRIRFDANGQNTADMIVTQMGVWSDTNAGEDLVYVHGSQDATLSDGSQLLFPTPTWAQRLCSRRSATLVRAANASARECQGHGYCTPSGACICEPGWVGVHCELDEALATQPACTFPPDDAYHFPEAKCVHASLRCPVRQPRSTPMAQADPLALASCPPQAGLRLTFDRLISAAFRLVLRILRPSLPTMLPVRSSTSTAMLTIRCAAHVASAILTPSARSVRSAPALMQAPRQLGSTRARVTAAS